MALPAKKWRWPHRIAVAAGVAFAVGGTVVAFGPAAPWIVDHLGDDQRVWRLGHIKIDGVSGSWVGDLRAAHVEIADEEGVWLEAENLALDWRPFGIVLGDVRLDNAHADTIRILRQPHLLEKRPSSGADFNVRIGALRVDTIELSEAVYGQAARFTADLALDLRGDDLRLLDLELQRQDSDADRAIVLYRPDADYALNADIVSAPGGILARLARVPEQGLRASALGNGDATAGHANYEAFIGETQLLHGEASWTAESWRLDADGRLDALPMLETLAHRIGPSVALNASGARLGAFEARAETPFFALQLNGAFNEERELEGPARIIATTTRLSDVARESPFELGAARLEGELRQARGTTAIRGTFDAQRIDALGRTVRFTGPVEAALTQDAFTLESDLRAPSNAPALFAQGRLEVDLGYDRKTGRFALNRATLTSDALALNASGWSHGAEEGEFAGDWRVRRLQALAPDLRGGGAGQWRAFVSDSAQEIWTITVAGNGENISGAPDIVPQLLGANPALDGMFRYENEGITVAHARVNGTRLRAGATGRIVRGQANLALEASARGPLDLDGAVINGVVDATGRLTGNISRPTLTANASMASFAAGGAVIDNPRVTFTLAPSGRAYAGRADVQGSVSGQALTASSNVSIANGAFTLTNLDGQVGALAAQGDAIIAPRGVTANLAVNGAIDGLVPGMTGRLAGDVALTPQTIAVNAQIADARSGDLRVRAATVTARGPLDAVATEFDMRGRLRQAPLAFTGTGMLDFEHSNARLEGRGELAGAPVFTRAPITANWGNNQLNASLNVAMADGVVQAQWTERGRALTGSAQIEDAPIAPLAAIWGERATGRIDGTINVANRGGGLAGDANLQLDDARFAGRQEGTLDMRIVGDLDPDRLRATIDAQSTQGLVAHFEADAPVVTDADPIRIALAPERRGNARWSMRGPAAGLWAVARLPDQSLSGQVDGEGSLQFGAGYLAGQGHVEIVDGRFEDKLTGIVLTDLDARVAIGDNGVNIERFSATSPRGGRLTVTGGSANPREGRIVVNLEDMRVADRPEAQARASGELTLAWEGAQSSFTGQLNIIEANVDIAANAQEGIPTIEVVEINRPGYEEEDEDEQARTPRNSATTIDVRVQAPGRVFTRGRGIDAEWALDMRLQGTLANPRVYGTATAIRGELALSGQPFEIQDARIIFNGDPLDARIQLTAERDTADLTARLHLTGTARDPEISFTSDPALPEDEILPQVLFGRSVEDLSGFEAAQLASSLAALSGQASFDIVDAARAATGLDRFAVRQDEDGGFLVAGGVYLTRDVYVEVARTGLGEAQTQVEWTMRPKLVLVTSFRGGGEQRVSLRWRRESD
jgi:translocation and assembly module TamB